MLISCVELDYALYCINYSSSSILIKGGVLISKVHCFIYRIHVQNWCTYWLFFVFISRDWHVR